MAVKKIAVPGGQERAIIENVSPCIDGGRFAVKRIEGESVEVQADIFTDGHDKVNACILYRQVNQKSWSKAPMFNLGGERWQGTFTVEKIGAYEYTVQAWVDQPISWNYDTAGK